MRGRILLMLVAMATACSRGTAGQSNAFNAPLTVTASLQTLISDEQLGELAARRGRIPETRQLGAAIHRNAAAMRADLAAIAARRRLAPAPPLAEKQVALRDNLDTLPGRIFDEGYALAMIQDQNALEQAFDRIARSDDPELKQFAERYRSTVAGQRDQSNAVLELLGGSPFGFTPE